MIEQRVALKEALAYNDYLATEIVRRNGLTDGRFEKISLWQRYLGDRTRTSNIVIPGLRVAGTVPGDMNGGIYLEGPPHVSERPHGLKIRESGTTNGVLWRDPAQSRGVYVDQGGHSAPRYDERTVLSADGRFQFARGEFATTRRGEPVAEVEMVDSSHLVAGEIEPRLDDLVATARAASELLILGLRNDRTVDLTVFGR
jgi:hypothetical protein